MRLDWPDTGAHLPALCDFKSEKALGAAPVAGVYLLTIAAKTAAAPKDATDPTDRDGGNDADQPPTVVYVGQSRDIAARLRTHRLEKTKCFHKALFYPLADEMSRLRTEGILILYFLPLYNRGLNLGLAAGRLWAVRWRRER